jgi:hypothetical protein
MRRRPPVAGASGREKSVLRGDAAGASPSPGRSGGRYARSTAMLVRPDAVDNLIGYIRDEVMPMVTPREA